MDANGKHRVLIAGGGVAAIEAALALRDLAADRVAVELLAPEQHFWYRPLSVVAPFELGEVTRFELDALARQIGGSFTLGALTGIDEWRHIAHTSKNTQITYDTLLIACGALPFPAIPGALTFRGPADIEMVEHLLEEIVSRGACSVAYVIPWGAVWSLPAYIDRVYDPSRAEGRLGFRCRTDFAAILGALKCGGRLPFAHDPSYVSPKELGPRTRTTG